MNIKKNKEKEKKVDKKQKRKYNFPKEGVVIKATSLEEAILQLKR